jgi:hypothetical protein
MGRAKDLMMQQEEQGWSFTYNQICQRCISDLYLKQSVKGTATNENPCSFCGRRPSAELDEVIEIIGDTVGEYYNRAVNEAPYDSAEGGYQGITYRTHEVLDDIAANISNRDDVMDVIREAFDDDIWVERNMFSLNGAHKFVASWSRFCHAVKHRSRYFFDRTTDDSRNDDWDDGSDDTIPVPNMLDALREILETKGLIVEVSVDRVIYRVRSHKKTDKCTTWEALGPPPEDKAPTNRMSPAGISVFYGAFEMATAQAEAGYNMPDVGWKLTGAAWRCSRPLRVLDLSNLPPVPSVFAVSREERGALEFLWQFVESITAPVEHDGREHIEYVPTQILTEYFRERVKTAHGAAIDGIVYPSARRLSGRSIVVFASQQELDPARTWVKEKLLKLDESSIQLLRRPRKKSQGNPLTSRW